MASVLNRLRALDDRVLAAPHAGRERLARWRARPTMRRRLREAVEKERSSFWADRDAESNRTTRLPDTNSASLVGLMFIEAATPSTLATFRQHQAALPRDPYQPARSSHELQARTGAGGWQSLGYLRPPGEFVIGGGGNDDSLPAGVTAVWLTLHKPIPSVDVLVATFVLTEEAGSLDDLLRAEYGTTHEDIRISATGVARLTRHIPWARPAVGLGYSIIDASTAKDRAVESRIRQIEDECSTWLEKALPGRFALEPAERRPRVAILATDGMTPYSNDLPQLEPLGLRGPKWDVWHCPESPGWMGSFRTPLRSRSERATWSARRDELPGSRDSRSDAEARENWAVGARFHEEQGPLFVYWGLWRLLHVYETVLAEFRDTSARRRRPGRTRPVTQAKALDDLLTGDGMDAAAVCQDIAQHLSDVNRLRFHAQEYIQDDETPGRRRRARPQRNLLEEVHTTLQQQATNLPRRWESVLANVRASAELRQAVANTRLQRVLLPISVAALVVAIAGTGGSTRPADGVPDNLSPTQAATATPGPAPASSRPTTRSGAIATPTPSPRH